MVSKGANVEAEGHICGSKVSEAGNKQTYVLLSKSLEASGSCNMKGALQAAVQGICKQI